MAVEIGGTKPQSLGRKLAYSAGSLAGSMAPGTFAAFAMFFYVDLLAMRPYLFSLAMIIYSIWNAINDPLFGQISDRTRTRWGRRIPYIAFGAIPLAVAFALIWMPPDAVRSGDWLGYPKLFWYFLVVAFLFDGLYTMVILNWTALFPEMYPNLEERAQVSGLRQSFTVIGMIIGTALSPTIYGKLGWPMLGGILGAVTCISLFISLLGSRERPEFRGDEPLALWPALKHTFANRSFITYVIAGLLIQLTFTIMQGAIPFYCKYVLRIEGFQVSLLLGVVFIVALPFLYFWQRMTVRWGARRTIMTAATIYALALVPFLFIKSFVGGLITAALVGIGVAGPMLLLDVLLSDVIDEDELRTGVRREGMYFGMNALIVRLGISVQAIISAVVLEMSGYDATLPIEAQPASAIMGMRLLMTVVPIAIVLLALLVWRLYPLHGGYLESVKFQVRKLHEDKAHRAWGGGGAEISQSGGTPIQG